MRLHLTNPFIAEIAPIDYVAGDAAGDFDPDFGELRTKTVQGQRVEQRPEARTVRVRCQIEDETFENLRMFNAGNSPEAKLGLVCDMVWLRRNGFIDPGTGLASLKVNDRLNAIFTVRGALVHVVKNPPGLYCVEARPIAYGISRRLNLLLLRFADRAQSQTT